MVKSQADRTLLVLIVVLFAGLVYTIRDVFEQRVVQAGDKAPFFSITTDDGRKITTADFGGKVLVLNFWATWCPPCVREMPSLSEFARVMRPQGVVVLGVSIDKNREAYQRFVQMSKLQFPTVNDPEADISTDYGTFMWPETYVIDRNGRVQRKYIAERDWMSEEILSDIKSLL